MPILVYHKPKLIYCAIEKCAITRLIAYFGATYNIEKYYKDQLAEQIFHSSPIDHYDSRTSFAQICNKYPDYFSFAFIRNPFDRLASNYHFAKGGWKRRFNKYPSFQEYVENMDHWNRLAPLCEYLDTDPNFIGKYESFKDDFDKLHDITGIQVPDPHPLELKANISKNKNYRKMYNEKIKNITIKLYENDFKRFGYSFDDV